VSSQPPTIQKRRRKITVDRLRSLREGTEITVTDMNGLNPQKVIVRYSLKEHTYIEPKTGGQIRAFDPLAMRAYLR
jgi:hypothetical protein